jgi:hypothetical protein
MRFKTCFFITIIALLIAPNVWAATPIHLWSHGYGDAQHNGGYCVAVDDLGNVVIGGVFLGTIDFGGGPLTCPGQSDAFVAKFDPSGAHIWSKRFGDTAYQHIMSTAVDGSGNVIVAGYFDGVLDFGGGSLSSLGGHDIFVAKLDPNGNHIWSKRFGDGTRQVPYRVAVDHLDNVIVTGDIAGTVDFGGGALTGAGGKDVFVLKLAPNGNHIWSQIFGDWRDQWGYAIAVDGSNNIILLGNTKGTLDFGGDPLSTAGSEDVFVVKFGPNGAHAWSQCFGDAASQYDGAVVVDGSGNVVIAGKFYGGIDFGGDSFTSAGGVDLYVAKFDPDGAHIWSQSHGDPNYDGAVDVAVNSNDDIVVFGVFSGTTDLGGGQLTSLGSYDLFLAEFDSDGNHIWSAAYGGSDLDDPRDVTVDQWDDIVIVGYFNGTLDLGGGAMTSAGGNDVFLAKYHVLNTSEGEDVVVEPTDESTGESPVTMTFDEVTTAGATNLSTGSTGPPPPAGFKLGNPPTYYELTTTAEFTGPVEICMDYSALSFGNEAKLKLFHYEDGHWVDRTMSLDTDADVICAEVTSFSAFAIFELTIGSVAGYVTADCPAPGAGFAGVEIDAYLQGNGDLLGTGMTDGDGHYQIDSLEAGDYMTTIVTPLSYAAVEDEVSTTVVAGEVATADFSLTCLDITPSQRSIGFWKHQVGVASGGNGNAQIDGATLCDYLDAVEVHFNNNRINEVKVYVPPASDLCADKLWVAKDLLNLKGNVAVTDRAKQQLMALLLNVAAGKLSLREAISVDGANVSQAITYCDSLIDKPMGDHETAKTICDWINNASVVPANMIPLDTRDIAYAPPRGGDGLPETFALGQNYPNPFNPSTVINYDVPVDGGVVTLRIFDVGGRLVRTLVDSEQGAGRRVATWDGTDDRGQSVSTGIYLYRMEARGFSQTKKMLLMK